MSTKKQELDRDRAFGKHIRELNLLKAYVLTAPEDLPFERIKELFEFVKVISPDFVFDYDPQRTQFIDVARFVDYTVARLPKDFLFPLEAFNLEKRMTIAKTSSPEEILDYIVLNTRRILYNTIKLPLNETDLTGFCQDSANFVQSFSEYLGFKSKYKVISPGYLINSDLYCFGGDHCFNIVTIKDRIFLVDCTYSQFFMRGRCLIEKTGIMTVSNCSAGYFMTKDEARKKFAMELLEKGWVELKGDALKYYLDGFTMSYRNGLYYEDTKDFSFTTSYTVEDYWNFLSYDDDQLNHEKRDHLGYQYRPLKNPRMKFHK